MAYSMLIEWCKSMMKLDKKNTTKYGPNCFWTQFR